MKSEGHFGTNSIVIILGLEILVKDTEKIGNPTPRTLDPPGTTSKPPSAVGAAGPRAGPPKPSRPTLPIEGLSPYSNNWTIRARVTQKSEIRTWSNQRGEGKLFSVTLMDETGEIRGTAFNLAVDHLYEKFQEGKVYYVSKARVNLAKKKFSNIPNDYELALEKTTEIEEVGTEQHGGSPGVIDNSHSVQTRTTCRISSIALCH